MIRTRAAALAASALILAGCSDGSFADEGSPSSSAATSSSTASSSTAEQSPPDEGEVEATPIPTTSPEASRTPLDLTIAVMTTYIDHSVTPEVWYERLAGYLSQSAQQAYYATDNALIPAMLLTGQPSIFEETPYLVTTVMNTDVGEYRVLMSRAADGSWQVERILPPEAPLPSE